MTIRNLGLSEIQECIKNRYPFLFLDKVVEVEPGKWAKGYKNFTNNEHFFNGHFQDNPNVPGAIQLEVMLEIFIMSFLTLHEYKGMETADSTVKTLKFIKKIVPGDRLDVEATLVSFRRGVAIGRVEGYVNGELACSCEPVVCIPELLQKISPKKG